MSKPKAQHELFTGTKPLAEAAIGDDLGGLRFSISAEMAERNAWANDDYNPWYLVESPFGGRICTPVAPLAFDGTLFYNYYEYPAEGSLFAKQEFEFYEPLKVGETYSMVGRLVDIYERKGRTFYKVEIAIVDCQQEVVMKMFKTNGTPVHPGRIAGQ